MFASTIRHHTDTHLGDIVLYDSQVDSLRIDVFPAHVAGEDRPGKYLVVKVLFRQPFLAAIHVSLRYRIIFRFLGDRELGMAIVVVWDPPRKELAKAHLRIVGNAPD